MVRTENPYKIGKIYDKLSFYTDHLNQMVFHIFYSMKLSILLVFTLTYVVYATHITEEAEEDPTYRRSYSLKKSQYSY